MTNNERELIEKLVEDLYSVDSSVTISLDGMDWGTTTAQHFIVSLPDLEAFAGAYARATLQTKPLAEEEPTYNSTVAGQLLLIRDELAKGDVSEAYHLLYLIADPSLSSTAPWEQMENVAKNKNYAHAPNTVPVEKYNKVLDAINLTIEENGYLADGDNCTLRHLVKAIAEAESHQPPVHHVGEVNEMIDYQPTKAICWCEKCDIISSKHGLRTRVSLCPDCGDKRCPKALNHDNECSHNIQAMGKEPS